MALPYHVRYGLVQRKMLLAAEVPATMTSCRAWVSVNPLGDSRYHVLYYEMIKEDVDRLRDVLEHDNNLLNREDIDVHGEHELERVLSRWLDDFEKLVQPYFVHLPV